MPAYYKIGQKLSLSLCIRRSKRFWSGKQVTIFLGNVIFSLATTYGFCNPLKYRKYSTLGDKICRVLSPHFAVIWQATSARLSRQMSCRVVPGSGSYCMVVFVHLPFPPPPPHFWWKEGIGQSENVGMMHVGTGSLEISSWGGDSLQCFLPAARSLIYERKREAKDQIPEEILLLIYDLQAFHLTLHRGQLVRVHYFYI